MHVRTPRPAVLNSETRTKVAIFLCLETMEICGLEPLDPSQDRTRGLKPLDLSL